MAVPLFTCTGLTKIVRLAPPKLTPPEPVELRVETEPRLEEEAVMPPLSVSVPAPVLTEGVWPPVLLNVRDPSVWLKPCKFSTPPPKRFTVAVLAIWLAAPS